MKKKLIGLMFAATMLFASSLTVFAADASGNDVKTISGNDISQSGEVTMTSELQEPALEVTITSGTKVIANPYGLTVGEVNDTLIGQDIKFENKSEVALAISIKGQVILPTYAESVTRDKKVTLASAMSELTYADGKMVFVMAEFVGKTDTAKLRDSQGKEVTLVYDNRGAELDEARVPVLAAQNVTTDDASDTMSVKIKGGTSKSPTSPWDNEKDKFTVKTVYNIQFAKKPASAFKAGTTTGS